MIKECGISAEEFFGALKQEVDKQKQSGKDDLQMGAKFHVEQLLNFADYQ